MTEQDTTLGYASTAMDYRAAGWMGVLPLPPGQKSPPPKGTTGYDGYWPSTADTQAWIEEFPTGANLGLRLPDTVVGIDVDNYGSKRGGETLVQAEALWGPLPRTVRTTSRLDGISGIRLFQVPSGTELETIVAFPDLGLGGIEVVQHFHRFCVSWPSIHPDTGRRYEWLDHDGNIVTEPPRPDALPELPQRWIEGLQRKSRRDDVTATANVSAALAGLTTGPMSSWVQLELEEALKKLSGDAGSRHDSTLRAILTLFRLSEKGESGVNEALARLRLAFVAAVGRDRGSDAAVAEWDRMVAGQRGHDLIASDPSGPSLQQILGKPPVSPVQVPSYTLTDIANMRAEMSTPTPEPMDMFDRVLLGQWPEEEEATRQAPLTSWGPVDMAAILASDLTPEEPAVLRRTDGKPILYAGRINGFVGRSGSGKSWCALLACAQEMSEGRGVVYLDFEDSPFSIVARLLAMGVAPDHLLEHFAYIGPDTAMGPAERDELFGLLESRHPAVIVVDGVNASMTLLGLDLEKNKDCTQFHQLLLKPLSATGATVIVVDHIPKAVEGRGKFAIGAQAKRAMMDGAMIGVDAVESFGRGRLGKLELTVMKDKPGGVLAIAEKRGKDGHDYLGSVIIDSRIEGVVNMRLIVEDDKPSGGVPDEEKKLMIKMMQISQWMPKRDPEGAGLSQRTIRDGVPGREKEIIGALNMLVDLGNVRVVPGPRNSRLHHLERPYNGPEDAELRAVLGFDPLAPGTAHTTGAPVPGDSDTTKPLGATGNPHSGAEV